MENTNALISMAYVSENANNPYAVFCEYIKYCMSVNAKKSMRVTWIKDKLNKEFGVYIPHNIILTCLKTLEDNEFLCITEHQVMRKKDFDTESFEKRREEFRRIEDELLGKLIQYVQRYDKEWTIEFARERLIRVLDSDGLAYDIFMKNTHEIVNDGKEDIIDDNLLPDIDNTDTEGSAKDEPLFTDSYYVGRFIAEMLQSESVYREYLKKICEGLMVCVGAYQLPNEGAEVSVTNIRGTTFYFDTRLLLRYVGCAGGAAVEATRELVKLIQDAGGIISYLPHTWDEMNNALEEAARKLANGYAPKDAEMRIYCNSVKNKVPVIMAKKASLSEELANLKIYKRQMGTYTNSERINFGFDCNDLQQYMRDNLNWEERTIENDARSIWEIHMLRRGNYSEYCGTKDKLSVFVTSNSRLIGIALGYKEKRPNVKSINGWKRNRIPVITDVRLTCRLWNASSQFDRISLLHLTANAVAAQQPTQRYLNTIRDLALQFKKDVPGYSNICLAEFFDEQITNFISDKTEGKEENLDISVFAATIEELTDFKAKEQEEIAERIAEERDAISNEYNSQTEQVIADAVERCASKVRFQRLILQIVWRWNYVITTLFAIISSVTSFVTHEFSFLLVILIPVAIAITEKVSCSKFIKKMLINLLLPGVEKKIEQKIKAELGKAERRYEQQIITSLKQQMHILEECKKFMKETEADNKEAEAHYIEP